MRQHLCVQFSCFVLATYFFVKVKGDSYQEWFQQAETKVGETALMFKAISARHCSAR